MELAPRTLIIGLPVIARRRLLTGLAAGLTLTLAASATLIAGAPVASASRLPAPGVTAVGNDISWPQCPKGGGGYGLPGPQASATFVVIGLTDGGSFRANPCLARQMAAAKARHLWTAAYAISTYPSGSELARYGGTGSLTVRLARVGRVQAAFNVATMHRAGLQSPIVWVDVEPSQKTPWSTRATSNNAVIGGVLSGYRIRGLHAGLYSYGKAWRAITGNQSMPGMPTWVPVGSQGRTEARGRCSVASFSGDKPWLVQWTDGVRDYNLTCPGVTGKPAWGNLPTPVNTRLALGSKGTPVLLLQRRLGGPKGDHTLSGAPGGDPTGRHTVDGTFGLTTKAKVVALQGAQQLPVNGFMRPEWRALGAGIGTFFPQSLDL